MRAMLLTGVQTSVAQEGVSVDAGGRDWLARLLDYDLLMVDLEGLLGGQLDSPTDATARHVVTTVFRDARRALRSLPRTGDRSFFIQQPN